MRKRVEEMSGIYINGMKMPKGCATCPYCNRTWNKPKCKAKSIQGRFMEQKLNLDRTRQKWCPLVPVPPHGRLIEESKVLDIVSAWCPDDDGSVSKVGDLREILDEIEALPTIIPAEEGE